MYTLEKISSAEAQRMIEAVVKEVTSMNKAVVVAVAGPEGELIGYLRMDGANAASSKIAQNKAFTAAVDGKSTKSQGEGMVAKNRPPAFWGDLRITGFGGGVPVVQNQRVVGGIGVSGLSEAEDERLCNLAITSVFG